MTFDGVAMALRVTHEDESHPWSDLDGEFIVNLSVTFA
jgi:hypothetical protein